MSSYKVKWYAALPQAKIEYGDRTIDFSSDETFDEIVADFTAELTRYSPSMIRNHTDTGDVLGLVRHMRVLTLEEAKGLGITKQTSKRMIYLGVAPKKAGGLDSVEYVSVGITPNVKDEEGVVTKYWLSELSATGTPHIRYQQTSGSELEKITFSAAQTISFTTASELEKIKFIDSTETQTGKDYQMEEQIKQLTDELAACKASKAESDTALETATARITELETELKALKDAELEAEADTAVDALAVPEELSAKLKALFISNREGFDIAAEGIKFTASVEKLEVKDSKPEVKDAKLELSARKAKEGKSEDTEIKNPEQIAKEAYALVKAASAKGETLTFGAAVSQLNK